MNCPNVADNPRILGDVIAHVHVILNGSVRKAAEDGYSSPAKDFGDYSGDVREVGFVFPVGHAVAADNAVEFFVSCALRFGKSGEGEN